MRLTRRQALKTLAGTGTFWNGAAFQAHDSAMIWEFTETLLPAITA